MTSPSLPPTPSPPPQKKNKSHLVATHIPLPPLAKKINKSRKSPSENMHIGWGGGGGGGGGGGYIQKFLSTVLVPPQSYISSTHPTTHAHTRNIAYPLPQSFPILP